MIDITVSVVMITYNHEKFIKEALESIFSQKTNFHYELIISNDCSTDNTDEVIKKIIDKNENGSLINYTNHHKNKGMIPNFLWAIQQAKGKYIALCEGDDYWVDPYKLQKQVDFLEANPDYSIHSGLAITSDNKIIGNKNKSSFILQDFYTRNNLITCTILFRNTPLESKWFNNVTFGDWMLYVYVLNYIKNSKAYCDSKVLSFYRIHEGGIMQTLNEKSKFELAHVEHILKIKKLTNCKFSDDDFFTINNYCISLFRHYLKTKNVKLFRTTFINLILSQNRFPLKSYLYYFYKSIKYKD